MAIGESKKIPQQYVKLVMNLDKVKTYPWGIVAFDHLLESIVQRRNGLKNASYILDGFTYALQVWAMEAIPLLGNLCGEKINSEITEARCSNWTGSAKLSWDQIIEIEDTFKEQDIAYPYISSTGNYDIDHKQCMGKKRGHKWNTQLLDFANGELPCHGKTGKKWALDFDRIYAPVFVHGNHWIAVCVNFKLKKVEVFDCNRFKNRRNVEAFAISIPRILKEIYGKVYGNQALLTPYEIIEAPLPDGLNKSGCDCGVYAIKYIECHLCGLSMDLLDDDNIMAARHRIAVELWEAANDPMLIDRMKMFEPPKISSEVVDVD